MPVFFSWSWSLEHFYNAKISPSSWHVSSFTNYNKDGHPKWSKPRRLEVEALQCFTAGYGFDWARASGFGNGTTKRNWQLSEAWNTTPTCANKKGNHAINFVTSDEQIYIFAQWYCTWPKFTPRSRHHKRVLMTAVWFKRKNRLAGMCAGDAWPLRWNMY